MISWLLLLASQLPTTSRTVAVTFDDLPAASAQVDQATLATLTNDLLASLSRNRVPAVGFVNEGKLYDDAGGIDTARVKLLDQWIQAGHDLGNHTFGHTDVDQTSLADYERDVLRGEHITRPLMQRYGKTLRFFRHPFLHTGSDAMKKNALERFLKAHGYQIAPVTIDNYDYVFARAYDVATARGDSLTATAIKKSYLAYMDTVVGFYERQARLIVGAEFPQILLLHANRLNAASFDELAVMLRRRRYAFVSLQQALTHPVYRQHPDRYVGPAGITWLHRWAIGGGMPATIFAGEPEVPTFVREFR